MNFLTKLPQQRAENHVVLLWCKKKRKREEEQVVGLCIAVCNISSNASMREKCGSYINNIA